MPYGEWEGGDLLLWEIQQRISIQQRQAVFFRGNISSHNTWNIKGVQNCVDLFTHENVLRKDSEKTRHDQNEMEGNEIGKARRSSNNNTSRTSAWSISTTTPSPTLLKTELYSGKYHEETYLFFLADTPLPWSLR